MRKKRGCRNRKMKLKPCFSAPKMRICNWSGKKTGCVARGKQQLVDRGAWFADLQVPSPPPPSPSPSPSPPPPAQASPSVGKRCGGAVNAGASNCQPQLWGPTGDGAQHCYAYGGPGDPCALSMTQVGGSVELDKDPGLCQGDTFYGWDEPETQGYSHAYSGSAWLTYVDAWADEIRAMRARGVKFTSPLFKADDAPRYMAEFFSACGARCDDPSDVAYIDVVAANPFCGPWNTPAPGDPRGCRGAAVWVTDSIKSSPHLGNRPIYMTNWCYLGGQTPDDQVAAIEATDAFFAAGSPVERVYWFGAQDYGGGTVNNFLADATGAGRTLGQLWADECETLAA